MPDTRPWDQLHAIATMGSYSPRRCGIGTFTNDLTEALAAAAPGVNVWSVAMNDQPEGYRYGGRVQFEVNENRLAEYTLAADFLNLSNVDVLCLQHEFGIYGGEQGTHVLELIRRLRMPVVATLHTVLKDPNPLQVEVTKKLAAECDRLVVMAEKAYDFLQDIYGIPESKVELIPHGIPDVPFVDPNFYKDQFGVEGKKVILTFGLLSPNKGIENMVEAMPRIVERHPDAVYMVLGATHPGVKAHSGEQYRLSLQQRAKELGVADHIEWFNKFVELDELVEFLGAADLYVTPYLNEAQITSGTLAYALGAGKATVSTPYWHAQELIGDDRGRLVPFADTDALADAVVDLFDNDTERHALRKRAYQYTRQMRWQNVAGQYLSLFQEVRDERSRNPRPVHARATLRRRSEELPEVKLDSLKAMTDDAGTLRHAKCTVPDREHGYATGDNARALVAVLMAGDHMPLGDPHELDIMIGRYLAFLEHAFNPQTGCFRSHMSYSREWKDAGVCDEAHGLAMGGIGEAVARSHNRGHMTLAANLFHRALAGCERLDCCYAVSHALIGIHAYLRRFGGDSSARRVRERLAERLLGMYREHERDDWHWPTDAVGTEAARLPHALLLSGRWMFNNEMIEVALRSLEWLSDLQTGQDGVFAPMGTERPYRQNGNGDPKARFDQLPADAAATLTASLEAWRITRDRKWLDRADRCLNWYLGANELRTPLYDHTTGGCHDSLAPHGVNQNQGAAATVSWLLSLLSLYEHALEVDAKGRPAEDQPTAIPGGAATAPPAQADAERSEASGSEPQPPEAADEPPTAPPASRGPAANGHDTLHARRAARTAASDN